MFLQRLVNFEYQQFCFFWGVVWLYKSKSHVPGSVLIVLCPTWKGKGPGRVVDSDRVGSMMLLIEEILPNHK